MNYKFNYSNYIEREKLLNENSKLYLIEDNYLLNEKYLIFTDIEPDKIEPTWTQFIDSKIDILQAENNRLKEVEKEQDKMIIDNSYKMAMIEANLGGM